MANGYEPPNMGEIVEDPKARKVIYKVTGYVGLLLTAVTAGLAIPFPETAPWLLSTWAVFGVFNKWTNFVADKNVK